MSARPTRIVEERLARIHALVLAMDCVADRGADLPGDVAETCAWLRMMAHEELDSLRAGLDFKVLNSDT
jgi:hypothetical protein